MEQVPDFYSSAGGTPSNISPGDAMRAVLSDVRAWYRAEQHTAQERVDTKTLDLAKHVSISATEFGGQQLRLMSIYNDEIQLMLNLLRDAIASRDPLEHALAIEAKRRYCRDLNLILALLSDYLDIGILLGEDQAPSARTWREHHARGQRLHGVRTAAVVKQIWEDQPVLREVYELYVV